MPIIDDEEVPFVFTVRSNTRVVDCYSLEIYQHRDGRILIMCRQDCYFEFIEVNDGDDITIEIIDDADF